MPARWSAIAATGPAIPAPITSAVRMSYPFLATPNISPCRVSWRCEINVKEGPVAADELRAAIQRSTLRFIAGVVLHNHAVAQRVGLGASDSQLISLLNLHGPLTPGRLAELTGLTTGTVTGVIDRLERAGYVRRERDAGDRRKVPVTQVP